MISLNTPTVLLFGFKVVFDFRFTRL